MELLGMRGPRGTGRQERKKCDKVVLIKVVLASPRRDDLGSPWAGEKVKQEGRRQVCDERLL
jgi:hypothetical protein